MKNKKGLAVNLMGLAAMLVLTAALIVFSEPIYGFLSSVSFLKTTSEDGGEAPSGGVISYGNYEPGIYEATVYGFESDITVKVEVSESEILSITYDASGESNVGKSGVKQIKDLVLEQQTAEVDAVAGSTYSSEAAVGAIREALIAASKG